MTVEKLGVILPKHLISCMKIQGSVEPYLQNVWTNLIQIIFGVGVVSSPSWQHNRLPKITGYNRSEVTNIGLDQKEKSDSIVENIGLDRTDKSDGNDSSMQAIFEGKQ